MTCLWVLHAHCVTHMCTYAFDMLNDAKVQACMLLHNNLSPLSTALSKPVWLLLDTAAVPGMYLLVSSIWVFAPLCCLILI